MVKYILAVVIVFLHFTFTYVAGFAVTLGFLASFLLFPLLLSERTIKPAIIWLALLVFVSLIQIQQLDRHEVDILEYLKTFLLILYNGLLWVFCWKGRFRFSMRGVVAGVNLAFLCVAIIAIAQNLSYRLFGSSFLFGILGDFSYRGVAHAALTQGTVRSYAFYLEPSYCALVLFCLFVILCAARALRWIHYLAFVGGIVAVSSLSGIIAAVSILLLSYFKTINDGRRAKVFLGAFIVGTMLILVGLAVSGSDSSYVASRLSESSHAGSSTYYRLIAPMVVITETLSFYPFGRGLGNVEWVVQSYGLMHAGRVGNSIDNAYYLIVFYFGWLGLIFIVLLFAKTIYEVFRGRFESAMMWMFVVVSMNFTGGGVFNAEYGLLLGLSILVCRDIGQFRKENCPIEVHR